MNLDKIKKAIKLQIAKTMFGIETLEEQKMDDLDFHDVSVMSLSSALDAAFEAGRKFEKENSQ